MNSFEQIAKSLIRLTGGNLSEVLALTTHDITPTEHGNIIIRIGIGKRNRTVYVHDDVIPKQLLCDAMGAERTMLIPSAVANFDCSTCRAEFAKQRYAEYNQGAEATYFDDNTERYYDALALKLVARTMGISIEDTIDLINLNT